MKQLTLSLSIFLLAACSSKKTEITPIEVAYYEAPSDIESAEPFLFTDKNNKVYLSWVEKSEDVYNFQYSSLENQKWMEPKLIASDSTWFVNWADYPMIATDGTGTFLSHVLARSGKGKFYYDVKMFASHDGDDWSKSFLLNDDGKKAEHGFVSIIPYENDFFVTWLDGRNTAMEGMENMEGMNHGGHHGSMSLRAAIISADGKKISEWELDNKTCDCCQTTAAITANGPVVIYRDRSDEEIRDISITRLVNNEWTKPDPIYQDNWKIAGCPVNGPRAFAVGNNLTIAWYSLVDNQAQVKVIFSADGGETFSTPIRVDDGSPLGRVDVVLLDVETALISWMEGPDIKAMKVRKDGSKEAPITIATTAESRSSGFPQMTKSDNEIIFAWTDSKEKKIKLAGIELSKL